jgi:hypothetical protein
MKRLMLLAASLLAAGGCSTEDHLLDSVHTPLVEMSPERGSGEAVPESAAAPEETRPGETARHERRVFGAWP